MSGLIVHEWLEPLGGAERVVERFAEEFPDAPVVCAWDDLDDRFAPGRLHETWLAKTPLRRHKALAMPFMLPTWRRLEHADIDWMLVSSHLFAHHAKLNGPSRDAPKFVYTYTPARYIWEPELDGRGGAIGRAVSPGLRRLDRERAQEAESIAAVSRFVADRVERCWDREASVIHPPVDVAGFMHGGAPLTEEEALLLESLPRDYVLGASRFVPYKRLDLVIAAGVAADLPVVLAGDGPDRERLEAVAAEHPGRVTFVARPSTALLRELYARALVYVFAPIEDFGIMPVESMAVGTPVVACSIGGGSETVLDGVTGSHFRSTDAEELRRAVSAAAAADPDACRARAWEFDGADFGRRIHDWMGLEAGLPVLPTVPERLAG